LLKFKRLFNRGTNSVPRVGLDFVFGLRRTLADAEWIFSISVGMIETTTIETTNAILKTTRLTFALRVAHVDRPSRFGIPSPIGGAIFENTGRASVA
jgi:hypothetical protein